MFASGDRRLLISGHWSRLAAAGMLAAAALSACGSTGRPGPAGVATAGGRSAPATVVTQPAPVISTVRRTRAGAATAGGEVAQTPATRTGGTTAGVQVTRPSPAATTARPVVTAVPPVCVAVDLRASFDLQPFAGRQPADRTRALIVVTDVSGSTCTVAGFATVDAVDGHTGRVLAASDLDQPGPPGTVELQSGGSAYAGLEWTSMSSCPDVSGFRLVQPATLPVSVVSDGSSEPLDVCADGIELGPFTAMSVGTVAFPDSIGAGS